MLDQWALLNIQMDAKAKEVWMQLQKLWTCAHFLGYHPFYRHSCPTGNRSIVDNRGILSL